jgi:hypothetical protein
MPDEVQQEKQEPKAGSETTVLDAIKELTLAVKDVAERQKELKEYMELKLRSGKF